MLNKKKNFLHQKKWFLFIMMAHFISFNRKLQKLYSQFWSRDFFNDVISYNFAVNYSKPIVLWDISNYMMSLLICHLFKSWVYHFWWLIFQTFLSCLELISKQHQTGIKSIYYMNSYITTIITIWFSLNF